MVTGDARHFHDFLHALGFWNLLSLWNSLGLIPLLKNKYIKSALGSTLLPQIPRSLNFESGASIIVTYLSSIVRSAIHLSPTTSAVTTRTERYLQEVSLEMLPSEKDMLFEREEGKGYELYAHLVDANLSEVQAVNNSHHLY